MNKTNIIKIVRFCTIYGVSRTLNKVAGRIRNSKWKKFYLLNKKRSVSLIGCGQFGFATISYFVAKSKGNVFNAAYDISKDNVNSLSNYYRYILGTTDFEKFKERIKGDIVYVASNHSTHTEYALQMMSLGVSKIYVEKPISTTKEQLRRLLDSSRSNNVELFAGYNRPYSQAIQTLKKKCENIKTGGISLNCFVSGHLIPDDHWYRNEEEGTRICGNMGHWIDLMVHVLAWRSLPTVYNINITYSDQNNADDNIAIGISTDKGDLVSLILTARSEPFEGINESINLQYGDLIAKIDDFRSMKVWHSDKKSNYRYFPKDVGHKRAIDQPFRNDNRDFNEVVISTNLMLHITEMVRAKVHASNFSTNNLIESIN